MFYHLTAAVRRNRKWLIVLASVIVFVTTYALILPAITIDRDTAVDEPGLEVVLQDGETAPEDETTPEDAEAADGADDGTDADEETTEEAVEMPPVVLEETSGDVSVKVEAEEGVFPADTTLVLNEVEDKQSLDSIEDAVDEGVKDVQAVEVAFENADGEPVQPQDNYTLTVEPVQPKEETPQVVVSLDETGDAAVVEPNHDDTAQMVVTPEEVPVVALVETEVLTTTLLSASGKTYEATVTFDSAAQIPEGSALVLTEFKEKSAAFQKAKQLVIDAGIVEPEPAEDTREAELNDLSDRAAAFQPMMIGGGLSVQKAQVEDGEITGVGMDVFDLTIVDSHGNEIEPAAPVQVELKMKSLPDDITPAEFLDSVTVTHLRETGEGIQTEVVAQSGNATPGTVEVTRGSAVLAFETDSFSTYTLSWTYTSNNSTRYRSSTIHYGYMNGSQFVEFPNGTPAQSINISSSSSPAFLIYDVPGYQFKSAHLNSAVGTEIEPMLRYYNSRWQYTPNGSLNWSYLANSNNASANQDIYMVYEALDPVTNGGTAKLYETASDTPNDPTILKESLNNNDGTRTLSLSVTGDTRPIEAEKLADIIVVFDKSGSMQKALDGGDATDEKPSRLVKAKQATNYLAEDLLNRLNREGEKLCRMALVTFSNVAEAITVPGSSNEYFTSDPDVFERMLSGVDANGGTNWEQALQIANRLEVDPERETFIIFVTDGNPTWRMTRSPNGYMTDANLRSNDMHTSSTYTYYRSYNVFGQGNSDNRSNNYAAALAESISIVNHNKRYFSIGISSDVTNLESLMEESGAGADHSFLAEDEDDLMTAIETVRKSIEGTLGWGDVNVTDGITALTNLLASAEVVGVDEDSFIYEKSTDGGNTWTTLDLEREGINPAVYEDGKVKWDMGENFQLAKNTTYRVSFIVWPSQEALDICTDLNNGIIEYESLPADVRKQIKNSGGVYTLETNTEEAYVEYKESRITGGNVEVGDETYRLNFDTVDPLVLASMQLKIEKHWTDDLTEAEDRAEDVHLILEARPKGSDDPWKPYEIPYTNPEGNQVVSSDVWLSAANHWSAAGFISPGLIDGDGNVRDPGYEFRLSEPDIDYHYELNNEIVNPVLHGHHTNVEGTDPALAARKVYITREYLDEQGNLTDSLTAENIVKGGIDLRKYVVDAADNNDLSPDETFTIHGYIKDPNGNGYTFDPSWDDRTDVSTGTGASATWKAHQNDPIAFHIYDKDDHRVGYKMHVADTADFTVTLKSGERIRFVNIPQNSTYAFWEEDTDMPEGYSFVSVEGYNVTRDEDGNYTPYTEDPAPDISADGRIISDTMHGNEQANVIFKNRYAEPDRIVVSKTVVASDGETPVYPNASFTISGYVTDRYGDPYTTENGNALTYNIVDKDGNYVVEGAQFPTSYTFTVTLCAGDRLEIPDIPALSSYLVWEVTDDLDDPDSNYAFVSITGEAVSTTGETPTQPHNQSTFGYDCVGGTVHEGEEHDVVVKNKMLRDSLELQIEKVDASNPDKHLNGAEFLLYADEDLTIPATDVDGNPIGTIVTGGFADAEETQPLGIGYVGNLLAGTYYLTETAAPPGYNAISDVVRITVNADGVTVLQPDNAAGNTTVTAIDGMVTITVTNSQGHELPHTGGPGTFLYTSGGLFLMAAAMIYLICVRRRERRLE